MKILRRGFLMLFSLVLLIGTTKSQAQQTNASVAGTFEYTLDKREGMAIFTGTHFIFLITEKHRPALDANNSSDSAKAMIFSTSTADVGTYEFVGPSRVKCHRLYSLHPDLVGKDFTFEYELGEGGVFKYWVLKPDGTRGQMGSSRKIKD